MAISRTRRRLVTFFGAGLIASVAVGTFVGTATAATTVQRPFPNGIAASSASMAWTQVSSRAAIDSSYARAIGVAAGDASFASAEYVVVGYGRASGGTNSAVSVASGLTVPVSDTPVCRVGSKVLVVRHKVTGQTVEICVGCGNVRLRKTTPLQGVRWKSGTTLRFGKTTILKKVVTCPSGQKVDIRVPIRVSGIARVKTWGIAYGRFVMRQRQQVEMTIRGQIQAKCGDAPRVPIQTPAIPVAPPIQQIICGNGSQQTGNGNAAVVIGDNCNTTTVVMPPPVVVTPPPAIGQCVDFEVKEDLAVARGVRSTINVFTQNTSLVRVSINWGGPGTEYDDGDGNIYTSAFQYSSAGTYTVQATATFSDGTTSNEVTCSATTITAKVGAVGPGSGTTGNSGGSGSGGSPGTGSGTMCRNNEGDIVDGKADQFGYCDGV